MSTQYRYVDSANGTVGGRHYDILGPGGETLWSCDTTGPALNETIAFLGSEGRPKFTLLPGRRIMNRSFTLHEGGADGPLLAELNTHGIGYEWKASAPDGREVFRIIDPTGKLEATLRFLFEGFTDAYAVVSERVIVGRVNRQTRPEREGLPGGLRGLVRRLVKQSDWVLTLDGTGAEPRQAVAAVLLLIELQIRGRSGMD